MRPYLPHLVLAASAFFSVAAAQSPVADLPYGAKPYQLFDWYPALPVAGEAAAPRPWVLFSHGSGSDKSGIGDKGPGVMLDLLRHNGVTVFAANWGNYPNVYPTMREDLVAAVQHIKANAATFGIDKDRMVLWGVSAGAVVAGWLTYGGDAKLFGASGAKGESTRPVALMNWGGLTNFLLMDPLSSGYAFGVQKLGDLPTSFLQSVSFAMMVEDVPRSTTPPVQSYYGKVSDPLPYVNPHDIGLMKDLHNRLQAFPSAWSASMQLLNPSHPHVVYPHQEDLCDWTRGKLGVADHPLNLGGEVAGATAFPKLFGTGDFAAGGSATLTLLAGRKATTLLYLTCGRKRSSLDVGGVTLIPSPDIVLPLITDSEGALQLPVNPGPQVPAGEALYLQFLHADAGAKDGIAASNAIRVVTG